MAVPHRAVEVGSALPLVLLAIEGEGYRDALARAFRVLHVPDALAAEREILRGPPDIVIVDLAQPGALDVCRTAKRVYTPALVLVMTADAALVPDALDAGCDAVLLQPFPPNLLFSRIGRLRRNGSGHAGTNQIWPKQPCPACAHHGVTSFDYTSHRRAWYACSACRHVWIGSRREEKCSPGWRRSVGRPYQ